MGCASSTAAGDRPDVVKRQTHEEIPATTTQSEPESIRPEDGDELVFFDVLGSPLATPPCLSSTNSRIPPTLKTRRASEKVFASTPPATGKALAALRSSRGSGGASPITPGSPGGSLRTTTRCAQRAPPSPHRFALPSPPSCFQRCDSADSADVRAPPTAPAAALLRRLSGASGSGHSTSNKLATTRRQYLPLAAAEAFDSATLSFPGFILGPTPHVAAVVAAPTSSRLDCATPRSFAFSKLGAAADSGLDGPSVSATSTSLVLQAQPTDEQRIQFYLGNIGVFASGNTFL